MVIKFIVRVKHQPMISMDSISYYYTSMKRFENSSDQRKIYRFDAQHQSEPSSGTNLRPIKGLTSIMKDSQQILYSNDNLKRPQVRFNSHNLGERVQINSTSIKKESFGSNDYSNLHQKLNVLENKILKMRTNIQKKREDKKDFLENQQRERQDRERKREESKKQLKKQTNLKSIITQVQPTLLKGMITQVPQKKDLKYFDFNPYSPRSNIYYVSQILKAYQEQRSLAREHLLTSMQLLKTLQYSKRNAPDVKPMNFVKHPSLRDKKTIVFDLDQTLIHCNENVNLPHDIKVPIRFPTGELVEAGINIRPYAKQLLRNLASKFQIIVFTASHSCYANVVLDYLDPQGQLIKHRLYREHCYQSPQNMYIKDLRILNRPLSEVVLVDNAAYSYAYQLDNGIPILPFYDAKNDFELLALQKYLQSLILCKDVRQVNRRTFKLHQYNSYDEINKLVRELYSQCK